MPNLHTLSVGNECSGGIVFFHGGACVGFDILRDEGQAYADALGRAGVKVKYVCHQHMIHHFYAMAGAIPHARTALEVIGADIKAALTAAMAQSGA